MLVGAVLLGRDIVGGGGGGGVVVLVLLFSYT